MLVEPPALIVTEVIENNRGRSETECVAVFDVLGQDNACVAKSNDISATSPPEIGHVTDVLIDTPTCVVCKMFKGRDRDKIIEFVIVADPVSSSDMDTCVAKHDEIVKTFASGICKQANVLVISIVVSARTVGGGSGLLAAEAPEGDTTIDLETDNVGATQSFGGGNYCDDR